jgi:hypothetical protein
MAMNAESPDVFDVVDSDDIRVVKLRHGDRFAHQRLDQIPALRQRNVVAEADGLERDRPLEFRIPAAEDRSHAALSHHLEHLIAAEKYVAELLPVMHPFLQQIE